MTNSLPKRLRDVALSRKERAQVHTATLLLEAADTIEAQGRAELALREQLAAVERALHPVVTVKADPPEGMCARTLVGLGDVFGEGHGTGWPLCQLPKGHVGPCRPGAWV